MKIEQGKLKWSNWMMHDGEDNVQLVFEKPWWMWLRVYRWFLDRVLTVRHN